MKKYIPKSILKKIRPLYHGAVSYGAHVWYGSPSKSMRVIGVTGTKGKSSTVFMTHSLLTQAGYKVGLSSSIYTSDGTELVKNETRNSMPGRLKLHRLMRDARENGCEIFIIEVTSEGLAQNRHRGIRFDLAAITNLYPEHLESHGGFEAYRAAKGMLFLSLAQSLSKVISGKPIIPTALLNRDDEHSQYYADLGTYAKYWISLTDNESYVKGTILSMNESFTEVTIRIGEEEKLCHIPLTGTFNVYNALFAVTIAHWIGVPLSDTCEYFSHVTNIPGRMNLVRYNPTVIVDYAHIPDALEQVYTTIKDNILKPEGRIIAVLGSCGGGRDVWKREPMGKIAGTWANIVIITDEDPYDEDPQEIIDQVFTGVVSAGKIENDNAYRVLSRREAFKKALDLATDKDVIIITGKGSETSIMRANGAKEHWNDTEEMQKLLASM